MSQPVPDHYLCQSKNIQAYFDDELDSAMHLLVERHIGACPVCDAELGALQRLQALIGLAFSGHRSNPCAPVALISGESRLLKASRADFRCAVWGVTGSGKWRAALTEASSAVLQS